MAKNNSKMTGMELLIKATAPKVVVASKKAPVKVETGQVKK